MDRRAQHLRVPAAADCSEAVASAMPAPSIFDLGRSLRALLLRFLLTALGCAAIILSTDTDHVHAGAAVDHDCIICETSTTLGAASAKLTTPFEATTRELVAALPPSTVTATLYPSGSPRAPPQPLSTV